MVDRDAYLQGMRTITNLLSDNPVVPLPFGEVEIYIGGWQSRDMPAADQIPAALAVIARLDEASIALEVIRASEFARVVIRGHVAGLPVRVELRAEGVCEHRPSEKRKRDRWVVPAVLADAVAAVEERNQAAREADEQPEAEQRAREQEPAAPRYAVRYTEHSSFDGRECEVTNPIVHRDHPDPAVNAHLHALRTRHYQRRVGLPVDATAVTCTVSVVPWEPVFPDVPTDKQVAEWVGQVKEPLARELITKGYTRPAESAPGGEL